MYITMIYQVQCVTTPVTSGLVPTRQVRFGWSQIAFPFVMFCVLYMTMFYVYNNVIYYKVRRKQTYTDPPLNNDGSNTEGKCSFCNRDLK